MPLNLTTGAPGGCVAGAPLRIWTKGVRGSLHERISPVSGIRIPYLLFKRRTLGRSGLSTRDRIEVAARNRLNATIRVSRWRRAAHRALANLPERDGLMAGGPGAWAAGRSDPPLSRAIEAIEAERSAILRDGTSIRDGRTALTDIANARNKTSSPRQFGELLYWLVKSDRTRGCRRSIRRAPTGCSVMSH